MHKKGTYKISISNITDHRIQRVKETMSKTDPDKFPEPSAISYNIAVSWMIDKLRETQVLS
jgi:hypothetical protein